MSDNGRDSINKETIGRLLNYVAAGYSDCEAIIHSDLGVSYTYKTLMQEINRLAKGLIETGINKGDRVCLLAPNIPEWIICQMALAKIGAVLVPIDYGATGEDIGYILRQSGASAIITAKELEKETGYESITGHIIFIGEIPHPDMIPWKKLMEIGDGVDSRILAERENDIDAYDPVAIMYTSGTTGKPKGVVLDHLGLVNKSLTSGRRQGLNSRDRLCLFFPLFHMFGNTCIALTGLLHGASIVMPCQEFEPSSIISAIHKERCTAIYGSPSMLTALIDCAEYKPEKWRTLNKGVIGGAPCPMKLMKKLVTDIGISNIVVGYGLTEASSWVTMTRPDDLLDIRVSTIGTPLECNEVAILDPASGKELPSGTQGELCTRGFLMEGYYKMPAATSSAIDKKGWFHSGDLGEMDEKGYIRITGRLKDVIVREGVEIYPTELEEVIYSLPGVSEVQVFGFPHPEKGQEVAVWIKVEQGSNLSLDSIKKYSNENIDQGKRPHYYKFVSGFPTTRSGKVQKFKLAEMARKEYIES